jgi:hypothetical protein
MFCFENCNNETLICNLKNTTTPKHTANSKNFMMNKACNGKMMGLCSSMFQEQEFLKARRINQWRTLDIS